MIFAIIVVVCSPMGFIPLCDCVFSLADEPFQKYMVEKLSHSKLRLKFVECCAVEFKKRCTQMRKIYILS